MKKNLICFLVLLFWFLLSNVQAQNTDDWDCRFVQWTTWWNFWAMLESQLWQNEIVYPKESIKRALLNLKAYCCEQNIIWSDTPRCKYDKEKWLLLDNHPDSKFLYDHLVDIWFRRLDAMEKLLYEWVSPDPIWKEWRDFINKKWNQAAWTIPMDILPNFNKQRTLNTNYILDGRDQNEWTSKITQYSNRPLVNRYWNLCEITAYIYWYLWLKLLDYTKTYWYPSCKSLSKNIISRNITFTKAIVLKKSNKLLYDNINSHITNYISQNRLTKLKETILWIVEAFNVVNKKVVKLIKECS